MPIAIEVFDLERPIPSRTRARGWRRLRGPVAFALSGLASCALARGDLRHAEELQRRALATAEGARAAWAAAHARVELGRILAAAGDTETAAKLYRNVLEWSQTPRRHGPRESLFLALAEDPAAAASAGLADLADARPVTAAAVAPP